MITEKPSKTLCVSFYIATVAIPFICTFSTRLPGDQTYTGGTPPSVVNDETISISGAPAADVVFSGTTLHVGDQVDVNGVFSIGAASNVTFSPSGAGWAALNQTSSGDSLMAIAPVASSTITLDRILFQNATGPALQLSGNAASVLTIDGAVAFAGNDTAADGGGILTAATAPSVIFSGPVFFLNNTAAGASTTTSGAGTGVGGGGGGIYFGNTTGTATFNGGVCFENNTAAAGGGGAIHSAAAGFVINADGGKVEFRNNRSLWGGGAIFTNGALFTITADTIIFTGNYAGGPTPSGNDNYRGGAIRQSLGLTITGNMFFDDNRTIGRGGAINAGGIILNGSGTFSNNIANRGGALYGRQNASTITASTGDFLFEGNRAMLSGGAMAFAEGPTLALTLNATGGDIIFRDNLQGVVTTMDADTQKLIPTEGTGTPNAINISIAGTGAGHRLTVNAAEGHGVYFYDPIEIVSTPGFFLKTGAGIVVFDKYYSNVLFPVGTVAAGAMQLSNGATFGRSNSEGSFTVSAGAELAASGTGTSTLRTGAFVAEAGAALAAYDGGMLKIDATNVSGIASGISLLGNGVINTGAALSAAYVRTGQDGGTGAQVLSLADALTLVDGAVLEYDLFSGNQTGLLSVGSLTLAGTGTIKLGTIASGTFTLVSWTGGGISAGALSNIGFAGVTNRSDPQLSLNGQSLQLTNSAKSLATTWTGSAGSLWMSGADSAGASWDDGNAAARDIYFYDGDKVLFTGDESDPAAREIEIAADGVTASQMEISGTGEYRFTGGALTVDGASELAGSGLSATGKLTKSSTATLAFANERAHFAGGMALTGGGVVEFSGTLSAGGSGIELTAADATLRAIDDATLGANIAVGAGRTATFDVTAEKTLSYGGVISGAVGTALAKQGGGTLRIAGGSSGFAGTTQVMGGSLFLVEGAKLGGNVTVDAAADAIGGAGTFGGSVTLGSGVELRVGGLDVPSRLIIDGLLTLNNTKLTFSLFGGGLSDSLTVGSLSLGAGTNLIDIKSSGISSGTFVLGNAVELDGANVLINGAAQTGSGLRQTAQATAISGTLYLQYTADKSRNMSWTGDSANGIWDSASDNWTGSNSSTKFADGDAVTFQNNTAASLDIELHSPSPIVSDMIVDGSGDITFGGAAGIRASMSSVISDGTPAEITDPKGRLVKNGNGTLSFTNSGANLFEGGILINGGTIAFDNVAQIGDGGRGIAFNGAGALQIRADVALDKTLSIAAGASATFDTQEHALVYSGSLVSADATAAFVKRGDGSLVFTTNQSSFAGITTVAGGTLTLANVTLGGTVNVGDGAVFGGEGAASTVNAANGSTVFIYNALQFSSLQFTGSAAIKGQGTLSGAAVMGTAATDNVSTLVEAGQTLVFDATLSGAGKLTKQGDGLLVITKPMDHTGGTVISSGTMQIAAPNFRGAIENNALVIIEHPDDGVFVANMTGSGAVAKNGAGEMHLTTGSVNITGAFDLNAGHLRLDNGAVFNTGAFKLVAGSEMRVRGAVTSTVAAFTHAGAIKVGTAAGDTAYGTLRLTVNGAYIGGGSIHLGLGGFTGHGILGYDKLVLNNLGTASGATTVHFEQISHAAIPAGQSLPTDIITGAGLGGLIQTGYVEYGSYKYTWTSDAAGTGGVWLDQPIDEIAVTSGVDVASIMIGRASLESLSQHISASRIDRKARLFDFWVGGLYRRDRISDSIYAHSNFETSGVQIGADFTSARGPMCVTFGFFYDYTSANMKQEDRLLYADTVANGYGVYGSVQAGRWYLDAIMRNAHEAYTINVFNRPEMETSGESWASSIGTGIVITDHSRAFFWEPQLQLTYQTHRIDDVDDFAGRRFVTDSADSLEGRAGMRIWFEREWRHERKIAPWLRLSYLYEFKGKTRVTFVDEPFESDLAGTRGLADVGVSMQLFKHASAYASASWYYGEKNAGYSFDLGFICHW